LPIAVERHHRVVDGELLDTLDRPAGAKQDAEPQEVFGLGVAGRAASLAKDPQARHAGAADRIGQAGLRVGLEVERVALG
jgi:hypothetical protein